MAVSSGRKVEISLPQKWQDMRNNNQRGKALNKAKPLKAAVIYYLCRKGQLEQPHFMVVPLSSTQGLFLKDVIIRLTSLRGQAITTMYSWSSKRSYKSGYVWHDLSEEDLIHPCHGQEYVLKGSQILERALSFRSFESTDSSLSSSSSSSAIYRNSPRAKAHRKNQSCGSFDDLCEDKLFKPKASLAEIREPDEEMCGNDRAAENGRSKVSTVLLDFITCGSRGARDCDSIKRTN